LSRYGTPGILYGEERVLENPNRDLATGDGLQLPGHERYLYLCGRYNLTRFLTESGQYREATEILQEDEELHGEFP